MIPNEDIQFLRLISSSTSEPTKNQKNFSIVYHYFLNRDGSVRWIFPKNLKKPLFLNFYNQSNLRGKLYAFFIKIIFYFNLFFKLGLREYSSQVEKNSILHSILQRGKNFNFSIFMGTVGENRKVIIEVNNNNNTLSFIKIGITSSARKLVENEYLALKKLLKKENFNFKIPRILNYSDGTLEISNINSDESFQSSELDENHLSTMKSLMSVGVFYKKYEDLITHKQINDGINKLENRLKGSNLNNKIKLDVLLNQLKKIHSLIDKNNNMCCSSCHGDFTPWNIYKKNNQLFVIDWEMYKEDVPVFFDIFHYAFQSEILLNKSDYGNIKQYYLFYLLFNITEYLNLYVVQERPHQQIYWMVGVWEKAMEDIINQNGRLLR
jgi:thiamine kinase-like enzyme